MVVASRYKPEGHRPRPSGLDPRAAVRRRWRRPRPAAARLLPADPQEDEGRRPARCPVRPGPSRPHPRRRRRWSRATRRRPRPALDAARRPDRAQEPARRARAQRRRVAEVGCATSTNVHVLVADQLNTYDVLCADDIVFTQGCARRVPGRPGQAAGPKSEAARQPRLRPRPRPRGSQGEAAEAQDTPRQGADDEETSEPSKDPRDILIAPVVSEKSYGLLDEGKYTFLVDPRANKTEIKIAVEQVFGVKVDSVNTHQPPGQDPSHPVRHRASARTPSARSSPSARASIDIFGGRSPDRRLRD